MSSNQAWPPLHCSVRKCARELAPREGGQWKCSAGHAFDRAKEGYFNLLQPQDRRAKQAGDAREAVLARSRLWQAGVFSPLLEALRERSLAAERLLDLGAGSGEALAHLAENRLGLGLDLSTHAMRQAARRFPQQCWLVANVDHGLPLGEQSFDLLLSITGPRHPAEMARVLRRGGRVLLSVPAAEDLRELRLLLQGADHAKDRSSGWIERMRPHFQLQERTHVLWRAELDAGQLTDLALSTYRAGRFSRAEALGGSAHLQVTLAHDVLCFGLGPPKPGMANSGNNAPTQVGLWR